MTKEILFNKELFSKIIKSRLSDLESETTKKLRSIMVAEATSNAGKVNSDLNKLLSDFKKTVTIKPEPSKNVKFPDKVYSAIMQRVIAVEAPKITGGELAAGSIIKSIGGYISEILNKNTETVEGYTLSSPFGSTLAYVTVIAPDGKSYDFSWNNSETKTSFNSFMKKLNDFAEERATIGIFTALLDDARNAGVIASGKDLLSKWIESFKNSRKLNKLVSELTVSNSNWDFFGKLATYEKEKNSMVNSAVEEFAKDFKTITEPYKVFIKKINNSLGKLLEKIENKIEWLDNLTYEIFSNNKTSIKNIRKKYDTFIEKSVDLASEITNYNSSYESLIETLKKKSSTYQNFIEACNALETEIGKSKTYFDSTLEEYISYKISDVHDETISENHATIYGTNQNDTITVKGRNVKIYASEGADRIIATSQYITLIGEQGNDHFMLNDFANSNYVDAGADDDTILSYSKNNTINGNSGNDSILVSAYSDFTTKNEVHGGAGDDTINVTAAIDNTVLGEEGNDFIQISEDANNNTIIGGKNNDTITIENSTRNFIVYSEGDGNDFIYGLGSTDTLYIAEGDFSQSTNGTDAIVSVGNSRITLKNAAGKKVNIKKRLTNEEWLNEIFGNKVIFGTQQNDNISNTVNGATIDAIAGNDYIRNYGDHVSIDGGDGNDNIDNQGNSVTINNNNGNDKTFNKGSNVEIDAGTGENYIHNSSITSSVTINGGTNNDSIDNSGEYAFILGGDGNDTVYNEAAYYSGNDYYPGNGNNVTIIGDNGNDYISNEYGKNLIVNGGNGNDTIKNNEFRESNSSINGGDGDDLINNRLYGYQANNALSTIDGGIGNDSILNDATDVTINGNDGNDSIISTGDYVSINGGEGDDTISVYGAAQLTIQGGTGNDAIYNNSLYGASILYQYSHGDGNDTIYGGSALNISGGNYSTQLSGNDVIVKVGEGSILLKNVKYGDIINIFITGTYDTSWAIDNSTNSHVTIDMRTEAVDASSRTKAIQITGNSLDNSIIGGKGNDTLNGANGDDTLTGGKGNDFFIYNSGNDIITDYEKGKDKISLDSASISNFTTINKDVIFALSNNNSLTLNNMADKQISFISGSKTTKFIFTNNASLDSSEKGATLIPATTEFFAVNYSGLVTINAEKVSSAVNIIGNNKANKIIAGNYGSTLNGSKGKDSLIGGNGSDIFIYENKSGNKVIQNYSPSDTISLVGAQISDASIKSNDVILKVGSKKITVKGADSQEITISEDGTPKFFVDNILYDEDKTSAILSSKFSTKTEKVFDSTVSYIDASNAKKKLILTSGYSGSSTILGGKKNDSLTSNSGNDVLYGGKGNDSLYGGSGNDTLWGEAGKDKLYGGNGNNTLMGGKGNDSLWGGNDTDTFIYSKGDGKDIIYDFDDTDILQITDTFSTTYNNSKSEIYFKVGSTKNAITLKNFTATNFNINNDSYQISGSTLVKK